jgi:hypothetical protein
METNYWETEVDYTFEELKEINYSMKIFIDFEKLKAFIGFIEKLENAASTIANKCKSMNIVSYLNIIILIIFQFSYIHG